MNKTLQWAVQKILDIACSGFYGSITLKFEDGKLVHLEHQQSHKPPK